MNIWIYVFRLVCFEGKSWKKCQINFIYIQQDFIKLYHKSPQKILKMRRIQSKKDTKKMFLNVNKTCKHVIPFIPVTCSVFLCEALKRNSIVTYLCANILSLKKLDSQLKARIQESSRNICTEI